MTASHWIWFDDKLPKYVIIVAEYNTNTLTKLQRSRQWSWPFHCCHERMGNRQDGLVNQKDCQSCEMLTRQQVKVQSKAEKEAKKNDSKTV